MSANKRIAVIDIGSNTIHLLVADSDATTLSCVDDQSTRLQLGAEVARDGSLDPQKMHAATEVVSAYVDRARAAKAAEVHLLGTAAVRAAANRVELIDKLTATRREKQSVGASILGVVPSLEKTVLDQSIEQAHQRDRLQFKHIRQIDLRQSFLLPQSEQYDPLRARGAAALGAVIDIIAQQARAFDELRNQLAFQVERHGLRRSSKLSKSLEFSSYSVYTH